MIFRFEARESVGYRDALQITVGTAPIDISGWTFKATFQRKAGTPDFTLDMAATDDPASEGLFVLDGATGLLRINILPATLQGIGDSTGRFTLNGDLLGTPPGEPRDWIADLEATVIEGPTA